MVTLDKHLERHGLLTGSKRDRATCGGQGRVDKLTRLEAQPKVELVSQVDGALEVARAGQVDGVRGELTLRPLKLGGAGGLDTGDGNARGNDEADRGVGNGCGAQGHTVVDGVSPGGTGLGKIHQDLVDRVALDKALHPDDVGQQTDRFFAAIDGAV